MELGQIRSEKHTGVQLHEINDMKKMRRRWIVLALVPVVFISVFFIAEVKMNTNDSCGNIRNTG